MKRVLGALITLALITVSPACETGAYVSEVDTGGDTPQGEDTGSDTGGSEDDTDTDRPEDDTDTDDPDTAVTDTDDTDTDVTDTDDPVSAPCHTADPLEESEWTRTYAVTWSGMQGVEVVSPVGPDPADTGDATHRTQTVLTTDAGSFTRTDHRGCGLDDGALWFESHMAGVTSMTDQSPLFDEMSPEAIDEVLLELFGNTTGGDYHVDLSYRAAPAAPYLADHATLVGGGIRNYAFETRIAGERVEHFNAPNCRSPSASDDDAICVQVEGTLTFMGTIQVTVPAGTFTAFRVIDNRSEQWSGTGELGVLGFADDLYPEALLGKRTDQDLISDRYYVSGIGLVKEQTKYTNAGPGDWLVERALTATTGLAERSDATER